MPGGGHVSKKASKRARRRALQQHLPDVRRAYAMNQERRGVLPTTPRVFERQALSESFYLCQLGLLPVLRRPPEEPRYEPGPVITVRPRRSSF